MSRVAAATPAPARAVAWLHEVLEWTEVPEAELLGEGITDDELRALRLLSRTVGRGSDAGYLAHVRMIARADGEAGLLARTVKLADLDDRMRHPSLRANGSCPPYERAASLIQDAATSGRASLTLGGSAAV